MKKAKPADKVIREVSCYGSHYEMGRGQGAYFRPDREKIFSLLLHNELVPRWFPWIGVKGLMTVLTAYGVWNRKKITDQFRKFSPSQTERLYGLAEGLELPVWTLLGLMNIEALAATIRYSMGCTSLAIGKTLSKTKEPFLAYNHDFPGFLKDWLVVRRSRPFQGYASLQVTYPALPGAICGVNAEGLAISLNHAFTTEPAKVGVPPSLMVQEALDHCRTADEVKKLFSKTPFACGSMVTVMDKKGVMYVLELARNRFGVRKPTEDYSLTLNDYQLHPLREIEIPQEAMFDARQFPKPFHDLPIHRHNWERRARFQKLLKKEAKWSAEDLKKVLADHQGLKQGSLGSICRHHATGETIGSAILYPAQGKIEVGRGQPCRTSYQAFSL